MEQNEFEFVELKSVKGFKIFNIVPNKNGRYIAQAAVSPKFNNRAEVHNVYFYEVWYTPLFKCNYIIGREIEKSEHNFSQFDIVDAWTEEDEKRSLEEGFGVFDEEEAFLQSEDLIEWANEASIDEVLSFLEKRVLHKLKYKESEYLRKEEQILLEVLKNRN